MKREELVLNWRKKQQERTRVLTSYRWLSERSGRRRKKQQERTRVLTAVRDILDRGLPGAYTKDFYERKCDEAYQHIDDSYDGQGRSVYAAAS